MAVTRLRPTAEHTLVSLTIRVTKQWSPECMSTSDLSAQQLATALNVKDFLRTELDFREY